MFWWGRLARPVPPLRAQAQGEGDRETSDSARLDAPVKQVGDQRIAVKTAEGAGAIPVYADRSVDAPAPEVRRVLVIVHGILRNADVYFSTGQKIVQNAGEAAAGTMVVAPQFLTQTDVRAFHLQGDMLGWSKHGWARGDAALGPAPVSAFSALDAVLAHFANRERYPALREVLLIGHSGGGRILNRYVATSDGEAVLRRAGIGIGIRYVVANPGSYLYFDRDRPAPAGGLRPADLQACPAANEWQYGLDKAPPYVARQDAASLEGRYASRGVVYLLGGADTDPYLHFFDRSCGAMAQGPNRLARGHAYFDYLKGRHAANFNQRIVEVPGVGHDNLGMFNSACGVAVLFERELPERCPLFR
ncbi:alpha/beta hydrolase [Variovorax paradoxus]|uniref:alpha/beta hydrolase n=1 Tax=Variovorax paradoxus TaxID=34073 RepID=UPI0038D1A6C5